MGSIPIGSMVRGAGSRVPCVDDGPLYAATTTAVVTGTLAIWFSLLWR
jgi:hypothetical protein